MITAEMAKEIASQYDSEIRTIDELAEHIIETSKLGLENTNIIVDLAIVGDVLKHLIKNGYGVHADISTHAATAYLEIEWFKLQKESFKNES